MKKPADKWLNYAKKDLLTIERILEDEELTNIVAFHAQQCIEKSLKAIIVQQKNEIPRIHNLIKLYGTVRNYVQLSFDMDIFEQINETYTDTRYPSDFGLLPDGMPSIEKTLLFYETSRKIYIQIRDAILSDGVG